MAKRVTPRLEKGSSNELLATFQSILEEDSLPIPPPNPRFMSRRRPRLDPALVEPPSHTALVMLMRHMVEKVLNLEVGPQRAKLILEKLDEMRDIGREDWRCNELRRALKARLVDRFGKVPRVVKSQIEYYDLATLEYWLRWLPTAPTLGALIYKQQPVQPSRSGQAVTGKPKAAKPAGTPAPVKTRARAPRSSRGAT